MERKTWFWIGGGVVALIVLFFSGTLAFLNRPVNAVVAGEPDLSCFVDEDCVLRRVTCDAGCVGELRLVSSRWEGPVCVFPRQSIFGGVPECFIEPMRVQVPGCVAGQCVLVPRG